MRLSELALLAVSLTMVSCNGCGSSGGAGAASPSAGSLESDVIQHHHHANRDGLYIDSSFSFAAASNFHLDSTFSGTIQGATYAQPLFVSSGPSGKAIFAR